MLPSWAAVLAQGVRREVPLFLGFLDGHWQRLGWAGGMVRIAQLPGWGVSIPVMFSTMKKKGNI